MEVNNFDLKAPDWDKNEERINRAKVIYKRIVEIIKINKPDTILDYGCGTGLLGFNFINDVSLVCFADTSSGMLAEINKKANQQNVTNYKTINLNESNELGKYSAITSLLALHHIEDLENVLNNLLKHIEKDGYIVLSDLDIEDGSFHYPEIVPHNGIDRNIILNCLNNSNYELICNETVYVQKKTVNDKQVEFPIFLIIGRNKKTETLS
jgi:2-polyprenyl-3-methyl-5-hydroxy-6-metoxy-1,4-benzoquinol methylase